MTDLNAVPYTSAVPVYSRDADHLRILSIMHYVWGGLVMLLSCMFIFHVVIGALIASGHFAFPAPPTTGPAAPPAFPREAGYLFVAFGGCAIVCGWALGILSIVSGRHMMARRARLFSMVIAGLDCISFPLGTVLGVFTIIVLSRDSVKAMYAAAADQRTIA